MRRLWMPFYVGDYVADTLHLTTLQHGAYLLLILHYWSHGCLPTDPRQLMAIARMSEAEWSSNCHALAMLFLKDWRHKRLDEELLKANKLIQAKSLAGMKGAMVRYGRFPKAV